MRHLSEFVRTRWREPAIYRAPRGDANAVAAKNVIASQRVRPEVAGPMTSSAKQSSAAPPLWIASSSLRGSSQ
jgi:hypothetical protein